MTASLKDNQETQITEKKAASFDGSLGVFGTVALILLLWGFCWLKSYSSFRIPQYVHVMFHEVAGLSTNAGVFVDGVRVGIVDKIDWKQRKNVLVTIRINSARVNIPEGSKFVILTNGIVGAKYVEICLPTKSESGKLIDDKEVVMGEDPVRPELAVNNIAIGLSDINFTELRHTVAEDHKRLIGATDQIHTLVDKTFPLIDRTLPLEKKADLLADDLSKITKKLSKLVDNPNFSGDLKETATQIRETMVHVQEVVNQVNTTLTDKSVRNDVYATLAQLNQATTSMEKSMEVVQSMSADGQLRGDLKQMLKDARLAMTKVDKIVSDPEFGLDLKKTLIKTRAAVDNVDTVSLQMKQILNKRSPLLHMIFGRPGKVSKADLKKNDVEAAGKPKKAALTTDKVENTKSENIPQQLPLVTEPESLPEQPPTIINKMDSTQPQSEVHAETKTVTTSETKATE
jgi:ABC-type transporter Mla subunit MlaD